MRADIKTNKLCIIGAGYCGMGVAKSFRDHGIDFDWYERNLEVGGNWLNGVYDSTHIISSRDTTGYAEFPMPRDYPDFPSRGQMLAYLKSYAEHFNLRPLIRFGAEIASAKPADGDESGMSGWDVTLANGEIHRYAGVVVANGHHWDKRIPSYPGHFDGKTIHSKDYKNPRDLEGNRVLVVGAGNSGCDLAVEAASQGCQTWMSMRRGYYFLPKTMFGIPTAELDRPWFPEFVQKFVIKNALKLVVGSNEKYGLQKPDHELFDHHPIVNSQLLYFIRHGKVKPKVDIERLDGRTVHFKDGTSLEIDTIVWATGFNVSFPFLSREHFEWENGIPKRIGGFLAPKKAGLYIYGLGQPRGGAGPLVSASAQLLSEMILLQRDLKRPLAIELARFTKPETRYYVGVQDSFRRIRLGRLLVKLIGRRARRAARTRSAPAAQAAHLRPPSEVPPVRQPRFEFSEPVPKHWYFGRPLQTHYANALHLIFPEGERFFVRSVRAYADKVVDPKLRAEVKGFTGQETIHGHEHEAVLEILASQGFDPSGFLKWYRRVAFDGIEKKITPAIALSATAALEHYTATLAHVALTRPFLYEHAHPEMRDLFLWHSVEEIEHKSVAFDVLAEAEPGYALRAFGLVTGSAILASFWTAAQFSLIKQDKEATPTQLLRDYAAGVRDGFFLSGTFAKAALAYLKPGFHPSQQDDRELARRTIEALGKRNSSLATAEPLTKPASRVQSGAESPILEAL